MSYHHFHSQHFSELIRKGDCPVRLWLDVSRLKGLLAMAPLVGALGGLPPLLEAASPCRQLCNAQGGKGGAAGWAVRTVEPMAKSYEAVF